MLPIGDSGVPRRSFPFVTYALIALNALMFYYELQGGDPFIHQWAFVPGRFAADPLAYWPTVFTSMFLHAGWLHLGGNMLYLWIFGDNVEDRFGHLTFLVFYLLCGIAAVFAQSAADIRLGVPFLGASGAIAGVLGAYFLLFPRGRIEVLLGFFVVEMPALIVIGFWILLQLFIELGAVDSAAGAGGVAYMAHIGGFLAGFLLTVLSSPGRRR